MHQYFKTILTLDPNFGPADATDDSRALELASTGEYLRLKKHEMKAISLDDSFYSCSTANGMLDMFTTMDADMEKQGFVEWFRARVETNGCYKAQAFLLNCFIDNNFPIRDFKTIKRKKKTIGVGLEAQPRKIVLFHYAMQMCKLHSTEEAQEIESLLHAIFPYRTDEWIFQMINCHLDRNNGSPGYILEEVGHNGLIRLIFKFLVAQSANEKVSYYQLFELNL